MDKKHDLPAMPFYFGDWRKAPEIRALDLDVRMIWFEMLGFMWESTERGYLTINGNSVRPSVISKMIGVDRQVLDRALKQMEEFNIFSRRESDNAIYCRKMVRDERLRRKKSKAGKKGMSVRYSDITPDTAGDITNSEDESESEDETVSEKDLKRDKIKNYDKLHKLATEFYEFQYPEFPKQLREWDKSPDKLLARSIDELDKLHRLDGYDYEEIAHVLGEAVKDEKFWRKNILSLSSLRNKGKNGLTKFDNMANSFRKEKSQLDQWLEEALENERN